MPDQLSKNLTSLGPLIHRELQVLEELGGHRVPRRSSASGTPARVAAPYRVIQFAVNPFKPWSEP